MDGLGDGVTKHQVEQVLEIAFTVWNAIVLDTVKESTKYISMIRANVTENSKSSALIEQLISRKNDMFSDDHRMIGKYSVTKKFGEWRLWAEAIDPSTI